MYLWLSHKLLLIFLALLVYTVQYVIFIVNRFLDFILKLWLLVFSSLPWYLILSFHLYIFQCATLLILTFIIINKRLKLTIWWAQMESNHRPHAYQACALTIWAMSPYNIRVFCQVLFCNELHSIFNVLFATIVAKVHWKINSKSF